MMTNVDININERRVKELRLIKITSKRQITIPKSVFDLLQLKDGDYLAAYALDDKIILEPVKTKDTVYDLDVKAIITQAINEEYTGTELAEEIYLRLKEYNSFLTEKVRKFEADIANHGISGAPGDVSEVDSFNGLDVFLDHKDGEPRKET